MQRTQERTVQTNKLVNEKISKYIPFCNEEFNKFILLLRKGIYPY